MLLFFSLVMLLFTPLFCCLWLIQKRVVKDSLDIEHLREKNTKYIVLSLFYALFLTGATVIYTAKKKKRGVKDSKKGG